MPGSVADLVDDARLDPVEAAREYGPRRLPDDAEDRQRDQQADDRVGDWIAQPDADGAENHGQGGQAVRACVIAVGDQRGAVHLPADADAEHRHHLVAQEADEARRDEPAELRHRLRLDQAADRLVAGDDGAEQDDEHDQNAG